MNDIQDAIEKLSTKRRIVVIAGAGIATSAGVPDFRSKTGVLGKSGGKSSFDADLVWRTEEAKEGFYKVICDIHTKAREALRRDPTPIYQLLKLLKNQGRLVRVYTQNIDDIDVVVLGGTEIPPPIKGPWSTVFQLHGSVNHAQCTDCHAIVKNYDPSRFRDGPEACGLCAQRAENRTRSNPTLRQRTPSGILRPHVLLYNETNPDEEATVNCFRSDLKASPDAVVVIGTKLSIPTLHRFTHMLCGDVKRRNGVSVWISNEEPAEKLPNFDYTLRELCDNVASKWLGCLLDEAAPQQKELSRNDNLLEVGQPDSNNDTRQIVALDTENTLHFDGYINTAADWLSNLQHCCHEENHLMAPYVHAKPLLYKNLKARKLLEDYGAVSLPKGEIFSEFFKQAAQSKRDVRVGLFTTCDSNALEMRKGLTGSVWVFTLIKKQNQRMAILIFDPKNPLSNDDGTYRSKTRQLRKTCQAAIDGYKKYANVLSPELWHTRNDVKSDHFQAVIDLIGAFILGGDKPLQENDDRLSKFVKV